jgi:hypothetical protein
MLQNYRTEYKAAPPGSTHLEPHQTGIVKGQVPTGAVPDNGPAGSGE